MGYEFLGAPVVVPTSITSEQRESKTTTYGLHTRTFVYPAQRWVVNLSVRPDAEDAAAFGNALYAARAGGTMQMLQDYPLLPDSRSFALSAAARAGDTHIDLAHSATIDPASIPVGQYVQISGRKKIYRVTAVEPVDATDMDSDTRLSIFPALKTDVLATDTLTGDPVLEFQFAANTNFRLTYNDGILPAVMPYTIMEVIR